MRGIGPQTHIFNKEEVEKIAVHISSFSGEVIFASGILAGWLMGLLSWLLTSTKDTISKIVIIALITSIMSFTNLHHSIIGNIEIFSGLISSSKITFGNYLLFQTMALSGNAIGGFVFVGLFKYRSFTAGLFNNN